MMKLTAQLSMKYGFNSSPDLAAAFKYIDNAHKKEVAQYWADWLNANCAEEFGHQIRIPMGVFNEGLKLYHE